ncbi:hypothetical protein PSHT_11719, partial [Puccinia striiformis]
MKWEQSQPPLSLENNHKPKVIDMENFTVSQASNVTSGSNKHSWVWTHLKESKDGKHVIFQLPVKTGKICGLELNRTLHGHLLKINCLADPKLTKKKTKVNHMDLKEWSHSGTCKPKAQLNGETLKSARVYMIAKCALSNCAELIIPRTCLPPQQRCYPFNQYYVWTDPNYTAFMAVTAHFIDNKLEMQNLNLAVS